MRYLFIRAKFYYFRVRVPKELQIYFNNKNIFIKSLNTKRKLVAVSYSKILYQKFKFIKLSVKMQMDKEQITALVKDFTQTLFDKTTDHLYSVENLTDTIFYLSLEDNIKLHSKALNTNDYSLVNDDFNTINSQISTVLTPEESNLIKQELVLYKLQHLKIFKENIDKDNYKKANPKFTPFNDIVQSQSTNNISAPIANIQSSSNIPIYTLEEKYIQYEKHNKKHWKRDSTSNHKVLIYLLELYFTKYKNIYEITPENLLDFIDILYEIPNRLTLRSEFVGKDLDYIIENNEDYEKLNAKTINKYITVLNKFLTYCNKLNYTATTLKVDRVKTDEKRKRVLYDEEDLELIFSHIKNIPQSKSLVIKIALYSGMRLNEIVSLTKKDIRRDEKTATMYFDINTENGKRVKNPSSIRKVPIHPTILDEVLEYISKLAISEELFDITSDNYSRWYRTKFNRLLITKDKRKVFHSYRRNAVTSMLNNDISMEHIAGVVGHTQELAMTHEYAGKITPMNNLRKAVFAIDYVI